MTTDFVRACSIAAMLALAGSAGCQPSSTGSKPSIFIDINKVPLELRDEYASFAVNCSKCHGLSRALNANVTDPMHWDLYVARMMRTAGSAISPREAPVILRFLRWYTRSYKHDSELSGASSEVTTAEPSDVEAAATESEEGPAPNPFSPTPKSQAGGEGSPRPTTQTPIPDQNRAGGNQ